MSNNPNTIDGRNVIGGAAQPVFVVNGTANPVNIGAGGGGGGGDATAANQTTQIDAEQAIQATAGATTGAKVITDANGTLQQYLRGLVYLLITAGATALRITALQGAGNIASSQLATSTTAATLVVARPTRRSVTIKNLDTTITVYVGPATVTASNGMPLKAGESISVTWVGLIQVIAASGTPTVASLDEYD